MAEIIIMPKLGFNMNEGRLVAWYKKEGEEVRKGEALFSIETDKTTIDIEATRDGVLRKILLAEGEACPVTLPVAIVGQEGESIEVLLEKLGNPSASSAGDQDPFGESHEASLPAGDLAAAETAVKMKIQGRRDYDIVVIGGGPGGYVAAIRAAQRGKKTALIEMDSLGGVCLNRGCIPTKALLRSAEALKNVRESTKYGIIRDGSAVHLDLHLVQKRKQQVVSQLVGGVAGLLKANGVARLNGVGEILDAHRVKVGEQTYTVDYFILATGAEAKQLSVPTDPEMPVLTSNELLNLTELPKDMLIIGGGVIGIEFAYFLATLGCQVTIVEFLSKILPMVDEEMTEKVSQQLAAMGVTIYTDAKVTAIKKDGAEIERQGKTEAISASAVLVAVGRVPNLAGIPYEGLNLKTEKGAIVTDLGLKTSVENIYAIGDVNGKSMLAHTASMEGIVAVENICGGKEKMNYDLIPNGIYLQPELAWVGLTETQAREKYGKVKVGKFPLMANGKAKVDGEEGGLIKVILEPEFHEIVGVHLHCLHATDLIAEATLAMKLEATAEEMVKTIHPHPTISEIYPEAFHGALDRAIHFV